jgi:hypothetical protein
MDTRRSSGAAPAAALDLTEREELEVLRAMFAALREREGRPVTEILLDLQVRVARAERQLREAKR